MSEQSESADPAAWCDSEVEIHAERLGCSLSIAARSLAYAREYFAQHAAEAYHHQRMRDLRTLCAEIRSAGGNPKRQLYALELACGMARYWTHGPRSQADVAKLLRVNRATISNMVRRWKERLALPDDTEFSRSAATVAKNREARLLVLSRKNQP